MGFLLRIIFLVVIAILVVRLVKKAGTKNNDAPKQTTGNDIDIVKCAQCGVLFPQHDAISKNGAHFCNSEHLQRWLEHNE